MKFSKHILLFCCAQLGLIASLKAEGPLKVYILAGQSNMVGQGIVEGEDTPGTLEHCIAHGDKKKYAFLTDGEGEIAEQEDVWIYFENKAGEVLTGNLTAGYGVKAGFVGPELSFGEQIQRQAGEGQQILLIKTAWGGKSLGKDFRPPSAGGETGFSYKETVRITHEVLQNLKKHYPKYDAKSGYEIAGLAWHQGWNDRGNKKFISEYTANLAHLIKDLRKEFKSDFPVVVATTGMPTKRDAIAGKLDVVHPIERAQLAIADFKRFPEFKGNVAVVDTKSYCKDIKLSPIPSGGQHYHWNKSAETYLEIGFGLAKSFASFK